MILEADDIELPVGLERCDQGGGDGDHNQKHQYHEAPCGGGMAKKSAPPLVAERALSQRAHGFSGENDRDQQREPAGERHAGSGENRFDQDGSGQQKRQRQAEARNKGKERVAQLVPEHHAPLRQPLRAGGPHKVLLGDLEHRRPLKAGRARRADQPERERRQHEMPNSIGDAIRGIDERTQDGIARPAQRKQFHLFGEQQEQHQRQPERRQRVRE